MSALAIRNRELGVGAHEFSSTLDARIQRNLVKDQFVENRLEVGDGNRLRKICQRGDLVVGVHADKISLWDIATKKLLWTYHGVFEYEYLSSNPDYFFARTQINAKRDVVFLARVNGQDLNGQDLAACHICRFVEGMLESSSFILPEPIQSGLGYSNVSDSYDMVSTAEKVIISYNKKGARVISNIKVYDQVSQTCKTSFSLPFPIRRMFLTEDERFIFFDPLFSRREVHVLDLKTYEVKSYPQRNSFLEAAVLCHNEIFYVGCDGVSDLKQSHLYSFNPGVGETEIPLKSLGEGLISLIGNSSSKIIFSRDNVYLYSLDLPTRKIVLFKKKFPFWRILERCTICGNNLILSYTSSRKESRWLVDLNSGEVLKQLDWKEDPSPNVEDGKFVFLSEGCKAIVVRDYLSPED